MNNNAGSHYHSVGAHAHGLNSHVHSGPNHNHKIGITEDGSVVSNNIQWVPQPGGNTKSFRSNSPYGFAATNAGSYYAGTGNTGAASGSTANSSAFNSGAASGNTANAGSGGGHSHSFTGTKATISTMPPYLAVYMWKRTA